MRNAADEHLPGVRTGSHLAKRRQGVHRLGAVRTIRDLQSVQHRIPQQAAGPQHEGGNPKARKRSDDQTGAPRRSSDLHGQRRRKSQG